jgi:uncharacterized protein
VIEFAFWDASAILPLCVEAQASASVDKLFQQYSMLVWWGTPVEIHSAVARLVRMGQLHATQTRECLGQLDDLRTLWHEIEPSSSLRDFAVELPERYGLRAADALQLAAASTSTMYRPANHPFISGDQKLLDAASRMGFRAIAV